MYHKAFPDKLFDSFSTRCGHHQHLLSLILGYHIVIVDFYNSLMDENFISSYSLWDVVAFIFIFLGVNALMCGAFLFIKKRHLRWSRVSAQAPSDLLPLGWKWILGLSALAIVAWIPYLLVYWPGFFFSDTFSSVAQATNSVPWNNHHPVAYSFFIKCCIFISQRLGFNITTGCAICSLLQMTMMGLAFGYMSRWVVVRTGIKDIWGVLIVVGLAATPSIAVYSVALWKDPLFSIAVLMVSLLIFDLVLSKGKIVQQTRSWLFIFVLSIAIVCLFRSNGVFIAGAICIVLVILYIKMKAVSVRRGHGEWRPLVAGIGTTFFCVCVVSLGYHFLGIYSSPAVEGLSVPLSQMARVAASNGEMNEEDSAYLDAILPLDLYSETYRPACIDLLKWDSNFDGTVLSNDFFAHWISLGIKNPQAYFEAWEMQTFGFWTINHPVTFSFDNISCGAPHDVVANFGSDGIFIEKMFDTEELQAMFPASERSIPIGILNWLILYIALCCFLLHRKQWIAGLVPVGTLAGTLLIASPMCYWPRYEAAAYFLIPFFAALVVLLIRGSLLSEGDRAICEEEDVVTSARNRF